MPSFTKPTSQEIEAVLPLLSSPQHEAYFFSGLKNPLWIEPLAERNVFKYPPPAEEVEGGGVRCRRWPPSQYLARMASLSPREVADVFGHMNTDNAAIIGDMVDAANAMPADVAVGLVPAICRAAKARTLWDFSDASNLCMRLIEGKQTKAALDLAQALFTPEFDKRQDEPRGRDAYWYKKGLAKVAPALARLDGPAFLPMLCEWLERAVRAKEYVDADTGSDFSYSWRPAIEEHEQNRDYDFAGVMVGIARDAFEQAIQAGAISPEDALALLEGHRFLVFKRLRLHLIAEFAEVVPDLARGTMFNKELFKDYEYVHEYAKLVERRFDLLSAKQQEEWLGWVDSSPDISELKEFKEQERQDWIRWWQYKKLHWVREHLSGNRRAFYEQMRNQHGEPDMADLLFRSGTVEWGEKSPLTVEELTAMGFEQVVTAVAEWKQTGSRFNAPSIEGLASTFGQYVATDRPRFSSLATALKGRPAVFVRAFISQMIAGVKASEQIDIDAVVELCQWVISRPVGERTVPQQEDGGLVDKDWQWTRDEVAQFVQEVCKAKAGAKPAYSLEGLRESIWILLDELCRGQARSYVVHDIAEDDPRVHDYLTMGINSPRGKAVEAALEYARWVGGHVKQLDGDQEVIPGGFDSMPEVRKMLEWQITPDNRSFEAMSIIGSRINLLYWIDKGWLAEHAEPLFNLAGIEQTPPVAEGWAAWNAFLVWVRPHIEFYRILKSQFAYAAKEAERVVPAANEREQPMHHLGEHLMLLYGRGQLGLDDDGGLLRRFIEKAHPDIRRHVIGFVGRSLEGDQEIPPKVLQRFMSLWEMYWTGPGRSDVKEKPSALLFGTWFACGKFPVEWAMERLREFVEIAPGAEPDHEIVERLAETAGENIVLATQILDRMVRGDQEGWRVRGWLESAQKILSLAMNAGGEARVVAEALIDHLGRRGYVEFGKLLKDGR